MKEPIHQRTITMTSYDVGEGRIRIEGSLEDERYRPGVQHLGLPLPPGTLHHMKLAITVNMRTMVIEDAEAEMPRGAEPGCAAITPNYREAIGLRIGPGFKREVMRRVGGVAGCAHMTTLLTEMGPTAIQSTAGFVPRSPERHLARLAAGATAGGPVNLAANTCHMWADDGPLTREVRELVEGKRRWGEPSAEGGAGSGEQE
jgi:hypothetical protein